MPTTELYHRVFVSTVHVVSLLMQAVSVIMLIVVVVSQLFATSIGYYPWWTAFVPLSIIIFARAVRRLVCKQSVP
jgi:hypothetical protein